MTRPTLRLFRVGLADARPTLPAIGWDERQRVPRDVSSASRPALHTGVPSAMSPGPVHHIEHAAHAAHAARDPFDKRVTMTIAIVAALLACVTLLSHRAHNDTTSLQIESNDALTEATDKWNYFQSKKNRQYLYESMAKLT